MLPFAVWRFAILSAPGGAGQATCTAAPGACHMRLERPTPEEAEAGLRAVKTCFRTMDGPGPAAAQIVAAAQSFLLHTALDLDLLPPIAPADLARAMPRAAIRRQFLQGLVVLGIADGPPNERYYAQVAAFADALQVDAWELRMVRNLAEHHMMLFRLDMLRRIHLRDMLVDQVRRFGVGGLVKGVAGLTGLMESPEIASRYQAWEKLPDDSLGHAVWRHYRGNGFGLPGEKGGFPEAGIYHDFSHVLGGYGTAPAGEILVGAFTAGYRRNNPTFLILFVQLSFGAGINVTPLDQPDVHSTLALPGLAERMFEALDRGAGLKTDLSAGWDPWPLVALPLDEARARLNVVPPAGGYPLAVAEAALTT